MSGSFRRRATVAGITAVVATIGVVGAPVVVAGPPEEPDPSLFFITYPGWWTMPPLAPGRKVARVRFEQIGGSDSAGLDVCVTLPAGFRNVSVNGRRQRLRVTRGGRKICWFVGTVSPGEVGRAVVRATAPRKPGRYRTKLDLIAVEDAIDPGEKLTRTGTVIVKRQRSR